MASLSGRQIKNTFKDILHVFDGDLNEGLSLVGGASDTTRGVMGGGRDSGGGAVNTIQYITVATTGNATDFGDLLSNNRSNGCAGNASRVVWGGGYNGSAQVNTIQYVTTQTTGNSTDFGDLTNSRRDAGGSSGD